MEDSSSMDLITHLRPVQVAPTNEESSMGVLTCEDTVDQNPVVKISREGKRKQRVSQAASMINHTVRRRKKTEDQVKYLK